MTASPLKNSNRYSALSLAKVALAYGERSMNTHAVIYPYWENAARLTEDYAALFLLLMVLFAITPAVFVLVWLIRTIKRLITEAKDKTVTAIEEKIEQKKGRSITSAPAFKADPSCYCCGQLIETKLPLLLDGVSSVDAYPQNSGGYSGRLQQGETSRVAE